MRDEKAEWACNELEKLIVSAREIIKDTREYKGYPGPTTHRMAVYARFYWLRLKLSRITRELGTGMPDCLIYTEEKYGND